MKQFKLGLFILAAVSSMALWADDVSDWGPGLFAVMNTTKGEMVFELDYTNTPLTVTSFAGLAMDSIERDVRKNVPFYDGLTFYREIDRYAIFSGDPLNNGLGNPGFTLPREMSPSFTAGKAGTLMMMGLPTESNGSAFFITRGLGDSFLDRNYTPFGSLVSGTDVLNKLKAGDKLISVNIVRNGTDAKNFEIDNESFLDRYQTARVNELNLLSRSQPEVASFIGSLEEYNKTMSGIYYHILYEGFGDRPIMGQTVTVHYTGQLPNGTVFDSSVERGQPFPITIGKDSVIPGWLEAILDMKTGEVRTIVIPPELAYGEREVGGIIPANSWLIFSIQLLSIE